MAISVDNLIQLGIGWSAIGVGIMTIGGYVYKSNSRISSDREFRELLDNKEYVPEDLNKEMYITQQEFNSKMQEIAEMNNTKELKKEDMIDSYSMEESEILVDTYETTEDTGVEYIREFKQHDDVAARLAEHVNNVKESFICEEIPVHDNVDELIRRYKTDSKIDLLSDLGLDSLEVIRELFNRGYDVNSIAKMINKGVGEVQLIISVYIKGDGSNE